MAQESNPPNQNILIKNTQTGNRYRTTIPGWEIGAASAATVYKAVFLPNDFNILNTIQVQELFLALKMINVDQETEYQKLIGEVTRSNLLSPHPNIIEIKDSITFNGKFWVVMPYMEQGSLRSIMCSWFKNGFPEDCIARILKESLMGLSHIHQIGDNHKEINAGHIYFYESPAIKIGYAASIYEHNAEIGQSSSTLSLTLPPNFISIWAAAPENYNSNNEAMGTAKGDVWLIGITALELGYGGVRVVNREALLAMTDKIRRKCKLPKKEERENEKKKGKKVLSLLKGVAVPTCSVPGLMKQRTFSEGFENMVAECLAREPEKRPTVDELLQHEFFQNCKSVYYFQEVLRAAKRSGTSN